MTTRAATTSSDPLLASVRGLAEGCRRLDVAQLAAVLDWAAAHVATAAEAADLLDPDVEPAPGSMSGPAPSGLTYWVDRRPPSARPGPPHRRRA